MGVGFVFLVVLDWEFLFVDVVVGVLFFVFLGVLYVFWCIVNLSGVNVRLYLSYGRSWDWVFCYVVLFMVLILLDLFLIILGLIGVFLCWFFGNWVFFFFYFFKYCGLCILMDLVLNFFL